MQPMNDFGAKLRLARERRGLTVRQMAASTKISVASLEALERNDLSKLPGGIFSRGFVRSYAIEVGLEPDETVREFLDRFQQAAVPSSHVPADIPAEDTRFDSRLRIAGMGPKLVLFSIPVIALVLYLTLKSRSPGDVAVPVASVEAAPPVVAAVTPAPVVELMRIEVHPTGECWVRLTVDGERVIDRVMQAGQRVAHDARDSAIVEVGDAGAFAFSINNRPGRSLGRPGEPKTARITRATLADFLR